jgi:carbamoyl-phosphate synthase large subunit
MPALQAAAKKLAQVLPGATGPLCFQAVIMGSGEMAVFEINARFGGGYPLAHRAGARFSQWLLEEACGLPCTANDDWKEGVVMLRYDAAVFLND